MSELVARLRDAASRIGYYDGKGQWQPGGAGLVTEAAARIEELEQSDAQFYDAVARVEELERRCADKDANIAELIETLQRTESAKEKSA